MIIKFLRQSNIALLCIGDGCKDDYISIGFDRVEFLKFGFFEEYKVLDNNYYKSLTDKYNILSNINEPLNLLFVGQLIKRKNLHGVLKELIQSSRNITLNVAGDGPLKMELLSICNDFPTNINVIFHGHCSENELDTLYRNSHAFILFSKYEGWGAVVNQAVHYHLPILLSNNVRSGKDFLLCNNNGLQFNTERELVEFIDKADINTLLTMATNNNSINEEWCISNASIRLLNFIIYNEIYNSGPLSRI
ncbi:hypothetical protein CRG86_010185 [Photobacterium leiognathi]|nr:hypothetical protein CRG86_010185 [Photobacterium leiognathi]